MPTLKSEILTLLSRHSELTDREITNRLRGAAAPQQPINQACHALAREGSVVRFRRHDGLVGNSVSSSNPGLPKVATISAPSSKATEPAADGLSEDEVKKHIAAWLEKQGWSVNIAWAKQRGVDCEAVKNGERWLIEMKGCGSRQPMRVNYFLAVLGETLQRMADANVLYSIAFPDMAQFRNLWARLPKLAKERTEITAMFVDKDGSVHVEP